MIEPETREAKANTTKAMKDKTTDAFAMNGNLS